MALTMALLLAILLLSVAAASRASDVPALSLTPPHRADWAGASAITRAGKKWFNDGRV